MVILVVTLSITLSKSDDNIALDNKVDNKTDNNITNNNFLTIMLEQDDGTYKQTLTSEYPGDDYLFNKGASGTGTSSDPVRLSVN